MDGVYFQVPNKIGCQYKYANAANMRCFSNNVTNKVGSYHSHTNVCELQAL